MPVGFAIATESSEIGAGFTFDVGVPIMLTNRAALVPRGGGYLLFAGGGAGMMTTLSLGLRWQP